MKRFNLLTSDIENLELKLKGELPINRDELLALVNSWGRNGNFYSFDKEENDIKIESYEANEKFNLSKLDVSKISNFSSVFRQSNYNGDINSWDVSKATSLELMFANTKYFNSPLNSWDVSNVTDTSFMFYSANNFNSPLDKWNTSKVKNMSHMFAFTNNFNQPLYNWNTSNVIDMGSIFFYAEKFNQDLNSWNISKVININGMFSYAEKFNKPILWDVSNIKSGYDMFFKAKAFETKFNKGNPLPNETNNIKKWLIENRLLMEATKINDSKPHELDNFLLKFKNKQKLSL